MNLIPIDVSDKVCIYKPKIIHTTKEFKIVYALCRFNNIFKINNTTHIEYIKNAFFLSFFLVSSFFNGLFSDGTGHFLYKIINE